ncbi:hypothetical protein [Sphingobacterium bovistauri]|uniref:Four helix bundle sensory module for signal transduction n=1 Tax=Sphingobacterium bovistauri TaxID=2781959 RepID=A0ABS7Z9A0_9SPHI|nr:hypothetical protein [Sphingobacterium bovistauri]MCA5006152.1 hypothetical protein [Sphingobacterium bovistauri]
MHKKTPSKNSFRALKSTVIVEHAGKFKAIFRSLIDRYPFYFFLCMFGCMLISAILAFTIMRVDESAKLPTFPGLDTEGIVNTTTNIIGTYGAVLELEELQRSIALIIQKDSLSDSDSIQLSNALKRYEQIQRTLIHSVDTSSKP